ncbi:hypothetical protein C8Q80DRAFT_1051872, partial [Daedaleopsis nitida]
VRAVLACMEEHKIDLPLLLWAISYNEPELVDDHCVRFARTALLSSEEMSGLLKVWARPPRKHGQGTRSKGASTALDVFAMERVSNFLQRELSAVGAFFRTFPEDLSEDALLSIDLSEVIATVQSIAPILWSTFRSCAWTSCQEKENVWKDPDVVTTMVSIGQSITLKPVLFMIVIASFTRSNWNNTIQRLLAIYLKSCGTAAKAFDTLSAVGLSMSQKWVYNALEAISEAAHKQRDMELAVYPYLGTHDNVNFRFRTFEQRSDHHSHFDSGTAGTIYVIKDPYVIRPQSKFYHEQRILGSHSLITPDDIKRLEIEAAPRLASRAVDVILQIIIDTPSFQLSSYIGKDDPLLRPLARPGRLRVQREGQVTQHMLDTVHIEEASYEGNNRVLEEWLRQLKLSSKKAKKHLGLTRIVPWVGDQLTASRLRGLQNFRCDDDNSFERLDWLVVTFGWFHLTFAVEQSLHAQYYGTRAGLGLVHAFDVLDRRGLQSPSTQGTFHHTFEEALDHTLEARIRDLACTVAEVDKLDELRLLSPIQLHALAVKIYDSHASTLALVKFECDDLEAQDALVPSIMFVRDVLDYRILCDAIKLGDVQTMEDMLPRLLFRFAGGANKNYMIEVCKLLQALQKEWPDDLKAYMRKYCWLTNTSGHDDAWIPLDRAQEHNVRDIKQTYAAMGPFATWEYVGKISASIPCQRKVKDHVERSINHSYRGKSHTSPEKEHDIAQLQATYRDTRAH